MANHFRSLLDVTAAETERILDLATKVKSDSAAYASKLAGKSIGVIFAKQSTRTRVSFEVGIHQMGAQPLILTSSGSSGMQMGRGESIHDTAKVLSRYLDAIVIRTYEQADLDGLAEFGSIPVVNALTDMYHPCQALADAQTIREKFGKTKGLKLVYAGAGNNVAHSLLLLGPRVGMDVVCACPQGLEPNGGVMQRALADAKEAGTKVSIEHDLVKAVAGANAVYTDTWVSMGQDDEAAILRARLANFAVTAKVMEAADKDAIFLHCLPAHRGEEVLDEVIDGRWSQVFDQAENRLHAQKALLLLLLGAEAW